MNATWRSCVFVTVGLVAYYQAAAQAAVIGTATLVKDPGGGIPFAAPDAALGAPWISYAIGLQTTSGELIAGVDFEITGQLHQRWTFDEESGMYAPTANSANQTNGDSHLRAIAGALFAAGPSEDNSGNGSPLSDTATSDYGVGSYLKGIWGIPSAFQTTSTSLAYICLPCNALASTQVKVRVADSGGNIIGDLSTYDFGPALSPPAELIVGDLGPLVGDLRVNPPDVPTIVSGTLPVTYDYGTNNLTWMFDGPETGPDTPFYAPTVDADTGLFSWDVRGSQAGLYSFRIKASAPGTCYQPSDWGLLTVQVITPEPSSAALLLMATSVAGMASRRSNRRM